MELVLTVLIIIGAIMLLRCLFQFTLFVLEIIKMDDVLHIFIRRRLLIGYILVLVSGMLKFAVEKKIMPTIITILCMVGIAIFCFIGWVMAFVDYRKTRKSVFQEDKEQEKK